MRSRACFPLAAAAALAACSADATAPVRAEPPRPSLVTQSGCPSGFVVGTPADPATDENGDGLVCILTFQSPPDGRTFYLERDNKT